MGYFRDNIEQMKGYEPGFQPPADLLRKCEAAGAGIVKLNTNENPYPPSPAVLKAIAEIKPEQFEVS